MKKTTSIFTKIKWFLFFIIVTIIGLSIKFPQQAKKYSNNIYEYVVQTHNDSIIEVPLETDDTGLFYVTVKVNSVPLRFIIDSGCSTMLISNNDAEFLLHHKIVDKSDIGCNVNVSLANGESETNRTITIEDIDFHGIKIKDVPCCVSNNDNIDLLLGQAVLSKLGKKVTFDYINHKLYIEL